MLRLQNNIFRACEWANAWQMTFNVKKCKHMHLGNRVNTPNNYNMKDANNKLSQINQVDKEKDLGVTFQNNLKI